MKTLSDIIDKIPNCLKLIYNHGFKKAHLFKSNAPDKRNIFCLLVDQDDLSFNATLNQTILEQQLAQLLGCSVIVEISNYLSDYYRLIYSSRAVDLSNFNALKENFESELFKETDILSTYESDSSISIDEEVSEYNLKIKPR